MIEHDFDLVRRFGVADIIEWMGGRDHFEISVTLEFAHEAIDQLWIHQRLVTLNINNVSELFQLLRHFRDAIRPAGVVR